MKLKVCGLRDETNFKEVVALGIDLIGLIFIPTSSRLIDIESAVRLSRFKRGSALLTGLFQNQDSGYVCEIVQRVKLDAVQLYGDSVDTNKLKSLLPNLIVIKATTVEMLPTESPVGADYLLVDNMQGGSGVKFDWRGLANYRGGTPVMIAGGIGPGDEGALLELSSRYPWICGFDVSSRFETSLCVKDVDRIREFRELLRS